ncbi:UNVERIFIED_CONTAM: hypothetical protein FKN15_048878 [Acipenser sinensis]
MAAQDELNQLERVFLRLGHAETDEQLQHIISKFLPPVLLKLSSIQEGVRKKVMELLVHLNKRIKSRPKIQLPVETLLVQYQDPAAASFVTPSLSLVFKSNGTLLGQSKEAGFVLNEPQSRPNPASPQSSAGNGSAGGVGIPQPPPGMSFYAAKRIIGETPWTPEQLEQCKLGIVKFIKAEQVPEVEAVVHLVIASSDTRHSVATAADLELKSKQSIIDWNNPLIINKIYKVYLGDIPLKTKENLGRYCRNKPVCPYAAFAFILGDLLFHDTDYSNLQLWLGIRMPQLFSKDIALVQQFFEAMCKDDPEIRLSIQEALSMMVGAYTSLQGALLNLMEALIAAYMEKPEVQVRQVAMKFASTVFAPDHIPSRYLILLAAGDPREEVHGEAQRVLRALPAKTTEKEGSKPMPSFPEIVSYIQEKIILYLRMCLAHSAGAMPTSQSLADMQDNSPAIASYVRNLLSGNPNSLLVHKGEDSNPVQLYIELLQQLLSAIGGVPVMYCLLEVVSVYPQKLAAKFADKIDWIKSLMNTNKEDMRELAAQLYAVVVSTMSGNELNTAVQNLVKITKDNHSPETQHGAILALGYMVGRYLAKKKVTADIQNQELPMITRSLPEDEELIRSATNTIGSFLDSPSPLLTVAACTALGEISRNGALLIPNEGTGFTKLHLVESLLSRIPSGKENNKMKERAIQTLGFFPVGDGEFPHQKKLLQGLMDSVEAKQLELQFTVGEAITSAAIGTGSVASRDVWTCTEEEYTPPAEVKVNDVVPWVLNMILNKYIISQNPHVRQASCIWLLSLVKKLSQHKEIKSHLKEIQTAFISILSDPDELSQDVASKGLGMVYELGNEQDQQELVSTLVETLMTGKRVKHGVSEDTEVFQGGSLGKTPDGQSLSTYKELCALASDLNQPDLVYKFMNLANHHAMWNSRKGAAFGFNMIAAKAGEQLTPYLSQLVPRLYRYQFDPNLGIRQAMTSIWDALVTDKKCVDRYLKEILQDVISNLTNNMWRVRESSCLALNDLIRGRQLDDIIDQLPEIWETLFRVRDDIKHLSGVDDIIDQLPEIWETLFRVRDDIKESVRKAADLTLKSLSKVCVRMCEPSSAAAQRTVAVLLPCLLEKGIMSNVSEVRALSIQTLVKISKSAGARLKPHAPRLIPALLESLTVLEPQVLNYLSLRATEQEKTAMDGARLSAAKSSPMMETINMCLQHLDASVLGQLVPRLCDLLKGAVGLGTKGACASVIVSLTVQCPQDLTPYSGKLMSALVNGLNDRSSVVQKSFAFALGHVVRTAKDSSVEKLLTKLGTWYLEKEEPIYKSSCALTVHAIGHYSPDVLKNHAEQALPLAFLGMHEAPNEEQGENGDSTLWTEVWQDNVPGSFGGIRLYMQELIAITQKALQSQSWKMKAQGAAAMASIAKQQTGSLEELLKAIGSVVSACSGDLKKSVPGQPNIIEVIDLVLKECHKENLRYKIAALKCAADVLQATQEDRFQELVGILIPLINKVTINKECLNGGSPC